MKNKKIVIAGGSGFISQVLAEYFYRDNNIVIVTRGLPDAVNNTFGCVLMTKEAKQRIKFVQWNGKDAGEWCKEIDGADMIINLAGKSVNCRYTKKNKQQIFDSRTNPTKAIGEAIHAATIPPKLWLNAASATIYRHAADRPQDEYTGDIADDFSVQVCKRWEKVFFDQRTPFTRKVALRMAVTLGNGGVMMPYLHLCRMALGGRQGSGRQMYSWVHAEDVCRTVEFMFEHSDMEGAYNVCSPNPVTNSTFMQTLRKVTHHAIGLPVFTWMLKMGRVLTGTEPELLLKSRWVVPAKLQEAGFAFKYATLEDAFTEIVQQLPRKTYHLL